jgi:hypothetical protein
MRRKSKRAGGDFPAQYFGIAASAVTVIAGLRLV